MKKFLLLIAATCCLVSASAQQKLPKWTTNPTKDGKTVAMGEDREDAITKAVGQLYDSFGMQTDTASLRQRIAETDTTLLKLQRDAWVKAALNTSYIKVTDSLRTDTSYWVNCQITKKDLALLVPELHSNALQHGSEALTRARFVRESGDVLLAAQQYAKGLNEVMSSIHRPLVSETSGGTDIAITLFEEIQTTLDGLKISAARQSCPMVKGEEIPVDLSFHITTADGKDAPNIPVKAWMEDKDAKVRCLTATTDRGGIATVRVTKAPETDNSKVWLSVDEKSILLLIPQNVASDLLKNHINGKFDKASIALTAFDPTPTYSVELDELDADHEATLSAMMKKQGFKPVADGEVSDLVVTMTYGSEMQGLPEKHGDYTLGTFRCNIEISVSVRDTKLQLLQYKPSELDLLQPANKASNKIRARAVGEMMKEVRNDLPARLTEVSYDKRKVVFKN